MLLVHFWSTCNVFIVSVLCTRRKPISSFQRVSSNTRPKYCSYVSIAARTNRSSLIVIKFVRECFDDAATRKMIFFLNILFLYLSKNLLLCYMSQNAYVIFRLGFFQKSRLIFDGAAGSGK